MAVRSIAAIVAALLLSVQVVRSSLVSALAEISPRTAQRVWLGHPRVAISSGMVDIARAASRGQQAPRDAMRSIIAASAGAPLSPTPFLVRGIDAQVSGNLQLAERAFSAAEWRDGRSLPARYFLADHYFRRGDAVRGLAEVAALGRLVPEGMGRLAPYVASYAKDRANWSKLRELFRAQPALAGATLTALSTDASSAEAVLALADPRTGAQPGGWIPGLITTLVDAGKYDQAREVWARATGAKPSPALIFDPTFSERQIPPPFNWALASSTVGLAEREKGGGLHVIYYGQEDGALAVQLLLLRPGRYVLTMRGRGPAIQGDALQWRLTCQPTNKLIASAPLAEAAQGWPFAVPTDCPAERLELFGVASDVSQQAEGRIERVSLEGSTNG